MVCNLTKNENKGPFTTIKFNRVTKKSTSGNGPLISPKKLNLVTWLVSGNSWKQRTCPLSWNKKFGCCREQQTDPLQCFVNYLLDFLSNHFDSGVSYRTINLHRSTLSVFQIKNLFGQHPLVKKLTEERS